MEVISYLYIVQTIFFFFQIHELIKQLENVLATLTIVVGRQQSVSPPVFTICIQESALTNRKTMILTQTTHAASEKIPGILDSEIARCYLITVTLSHCVSSFLVQSSS